MSKKTIKFIKLINNERLNTKVSSVKGCGDSTAIDICTLDYAHCTTYAYDVCGKDHSACQQGADDVCTNYDSDKPCVGPGQTDTN